MSWPVEDAERPYVAPREPLHHRPRRLDPSLGITLQERSRHRGGLAHDPSRNGNIGGLRGSALGSGILSSYNRRDVQSLRAAAGSLWVMVASPSRRPGERPWDGA